jgi:hypothetical protein
MIYPYLFKTRFGVWWHIYVRRHEAIYTAEGEGGKPLMYFCKTCLFKHVGIINKLLKTIREEVYTLKPGE